MTSEDLGILVSRADVVSERIGEQLLALVEWEETTDGSRPTADGGGTVYRRPGAELRTIDERHLDTEGIAAAFDDPRLIVIASRHAGDTGPLLTAHHTGNFGPAEHGGADGELARAAPNAHSEVVAALTENAPGGYDVGIECTHHGPSDVGAPSLFVEVGSGPDQWEDEAALRAVATAILDLVQVPPDAPAENGVRRHLVGFGGGHYAPRYERVVRQTDWSVGHVAADWSLAEMGDPETATDVLEAAFVESAAEFALLDADRPTLAAAIEDLGYRVVGETWVRETSGVPLGLVESLESDVGPVEDGLRFGESASRRTDLPSDPVVGRVPADLLSAVNAVDTEATLEAVDHVALGYGTENSGSRVAGPVAFDGPAGEDRLLDAFVEILKDGYDHVAMDDDEIVVQRLEFDPALAREAGVSPGPDFGRLASGEPVTVDGTTVDPSAVTVERERRLEAIVVDN